MIPIDWIIPIVSLKSEKTESHVIESSHDQQQYKISIFNPKSSTTIPLSFQLELLTQIKGRIHVFAAFTFVSPEGPTKDFVFSFGGDFSANKSTIQEKSSINYSFLVDNNLVFQEEIHIRVAIHQSEMTFEGISSISEVPDPSELIRKILSPHDSKHVCSISEYDISWLCQAATQIMLNQPSLLRLGTPVVVVGDLHGQYYDLIRIFKKYGFPNIANYLFLGDYVDRGSDSLDIMILLLAFKVLYPNNIFLLRGNHESASITASYGFKDECIKKERRYTNFLPLFQVLPIAAIVGKKIFCVHGGIAPSIESLDEIENFQRPQEVPSIGAIHELLWSDPIPAISGFGRNNRGACVSFGEKAAKAFMTKFGFEMLIRAHENVEEGFCFPFGKGTNVLTVFSATEYAKGHNLGAVLVIDNGLNYYIDTYKGLSDEDARKFDNTDFSNDLNLE